MDVQAFAHFLTRFEIRHALGRDANSFAGARVAPDTCAARTGGKGTEAPKLNPATCGELLHHFFKENIDNMFYFRELEARVCVSQFLNQFRSGI